jgi:hypothetical protein
MGKPLQRRHIGSIGVIADKAGGHLPMRRQSLGAVAMVKEQCRSGAVEAPEWAPFSRNSTRIDCG